MTKIIATTGTKGGIGKTTFSANVGGMLHDMGKKVLFFDADSQPALSDYFQLTLPLATYGMVDVFQNPALINQAISSTELGFDIVVSNDNQRNIEGVLLSRGIHDTIYRLGSALRKHLSDKYDYIIIDCPGVTSTIHQAAILAADIILCPVTPDYMSVREFPRGTLSMIKQVERNLAAGAIPWPDLADIYVAVYRMDNTNDAKIFEKVLKDEIPGLHESMQALIDDPETTDSERIETEMMLKNHDYMPTKGFQTLKTSVPQSTIYKKATTEQVPVHVIDKSKKINNAKLVMKKILKELPLGLTDTDFAALDEVKQEASYV